jgi:large subunit ribosomal protein L4
MKIDLLSKTKNQNIDISDSAFGRDFNESLVHQAVVSFMAGSRQGSSQQKTRSDVRGGGKKPYRQKGTGRARAGTIRSPLWRGGGVAFAARPRDYSKKINKKMYRAAIRSIFSELLRQEKLVAIENPVLEKPKTKDIAKFFNLTLKYSLTLRSCIRFSENALPFAYQLAFCFLLVPNLKPVGFTFCPITCSPQIR